MAFGLRPYRVNGGGYATGGFDTYDIANSYTVNIFAGDLAGMAADGSAVRLGGATGATPLATGAGVALGVCVGFSYLDAEGQFRNSQWFRGGAGYTSAKAHIVTDPNVEFVIMADEALGTTVAAKKAIINSNASIAAASFPSSAGNTSTGNSGAALDATTATSALAFRVVGLVEDGSSELADGTDGIYPLYRVRFNIGYNAATNVLGL